MPKGHEAELDAIGFDGPAQPPACIDSRYRTMVLESVATVKSAAAEKFPVHTSLEMMSRRGSGCAAGFARGVTVNYLTMSTPSYCFS